MNCNKGFRWARLLAAALLTATFQSPLLAGSLVVAGDITSAFSLTNAPPGIAEPHVGQFYTNLLGSGTQVAVLNTGSFDASGEINEFYNSLSGVTSTVYNGPITPGQLAGVDLLMAPFLKATFSAAEVDEINNVRQSGGTLFVSGEADGVNGGEFANADVNALLAQLGSGMSIVNALLDIGGQIASGAQIATHPLTTDVTSFNYGATSIVTGGTPLFFTKSGSAFIAVDVPEPTSAVMLVAGALFLTRPKRPS